MAKNCSVSRNNPAKESNKQKIPEDDPPKKLGFPGGSSVRFPDQPVLIVYWIRKNRPLIDEFPYVLNKLSIVIKQTTSKFWATGLTIVLYSLLIEIAFYSYV